GLADQGVHEGLGDGLDGERGLAVPSGMHGTAHLGHAQHAALRVSAGQGGNVVGDLALLVPAVAFVGLVHQGVDPVPGRQRTGGYPLGDVDGVDVHTFPHPLSVIAGGRESEGPTPPVSRYPVGENLPAELPAGSGRLGSGTAIVKSTVIWLELGV